MSESKNWFEDQGVELLKARNKIEVEPFESIITSYQKVLTNTKSTPTQFVDGKTTDAVKGDNDAATRYLTAIQELEKELNLKTSKLASFVSDQLEIVKENKQLIQDRKHWENQIGLFVKRLEEEMLLNKRKDQVMEELEINITTLRHENSRLQKFVETKEIETTRLSMQLEYYQTQEQFRNSHIDNSNARTTRALSNRLTDTQYQVEKETTSSRVVNQLTKVVRAHATEVNSICFNASEKVIFSASSDGTIRAWDLASNFRSIGEYRGLGTAYPLLCVRASRDGEFVVGTGSDRKSFVWRVGTARVLQTLTGHKGKVIAAAFSSDSVREVITGSSDRSLRIWDIVKGSNVHTLGCTSSCNDLEMTGGMIVSAHQDGSVRFWDRRTKLCVKQLESLHTEAVTSVSITPSGTHLVTNSKDHTLKLVDPRTFEIVRCFQHTTYKCGFDWNKAAITQDGRLVAAGGALGTIYIWNTWTGELEQENQNKCPGSVACCVWRADGQQLACCDKNGFVMLWGCPMS
uniref:Uncharacterized protein AlNc14C325G10633 n=1 Tax=Albugo laibachii Nc14 TaxID=890382 RepID=F0WWM1_9STRA|nr:conserved hypothetical protein [Albugo laibachii Nc14]|eukprot:CCA25845.1 conserved hypothetical protein [Albugo laibachii Nc14]